MMNLKELMDLKYPIESEAGIIKMGNRGDGWFIAEWHLDIPQPTEEEIRSWEPELIKVKDVIETREKRRQEYPAIGDQLDAILKYIEQKRLNGEDLLPNPDLDAIIDNWRAVKVKHPLGEVK